LTDSASPPTEPKAGRPRMPSGYGIKAPTEGAGFLPWSFVTSRMGAARNYWICTTSPDGSPHAAPVWGIWHNGKFYFSTDRESRKSRNLAARSAILVHLESGDEVVVTEGHAEPLTDGPLLDELDHLYFRKYTFHLKGHPTYGVIPTKVFAWSESSFPDTATRWRFRESG